MNEFSMDFIARCMASESLDQISELRQWVYDNTQTKRESFTIDNESTLTFTYLPNSNTEYYYTGGTVKSILFNNLTEEEGLSDDYWALFVFPKAESVSAVSDLVLNSSIKLLNPDLDLSGYTTVHLLFTYDGQNICAIAAGY